MRVVKDGPHAADERFAGDGAAKGKKVRKVRLSAQSYYALRGRVACRLGWSRAPNSDSNYSAVQIVCYLVVVICATNRQPLLGAALQLMTRSLLVKLPTGFVRALRIGWDSFKSETRLHFRSRDR